MAQTPPRQTRQRPTSSYAALIALYNALFGIFAALYRQQRFPLDRVSPLDLVMLSLSTLRMAKLVSEDEITAVVREPFVAEEGGERRPVGRGFRQAVGRLVLCPTCTGTWIAAFLTYALHLSPRYARPFLAVMAASGASQFGDALLSLVYTDRNVLRTREKE